MCEFFKVSRSGYYDFTKRLNKSYKYEHVVEAIKECQKKSKMTYGYRRVHIWIEKYCGLALNPKTILKIMNNNDLLSEIRRPKKYRQMSQQKDACSQR